jgi:hypothetical protein
MLFGFVEVAPLGPSSNGDVGGDDAITDSWSRRFTRQAFNDLGVAEVEVDCYLRQRGSFGHDSTDPDHTLGPVELVRETTYRLLAADDPEWELYTGDPEYRTLATATEERPLTHEDARRACAEVDPSEITWSGVPCSEQPCQIHQPPEGGPAACMQHRTEHGLGHGTTGLSKLGGAWSCDRGHGWTFLIRRGPQRLVVGLPHVRRLVVGGLDALMSETLSSVTDEDAEPPVIRLLLDMDTLETLVMSRVPDSVGTYEVKGVDGTVYTRVTHEPDDNFFVHLTEATT